MNLDISPPNEHQIIPAQFPVRLEFPLGNATALKEAREAVVQEFRDAAKWKKLRCRKVTLLSKTETGMIYTLDVGHAMEFDWTWEGAKAFRPVHLDTVDGQGDFPYEIGVDAPEVQEGILWSGEVLEVDETTGRLFVVSTNPDFPPTSGSFYVRPFEFLECLRKVYQDAEYEPLRQSLAGRLHATEGNVHPLVTDFHDVAYAPLKSLWRHAWSALWGPPGTGKTYTIGQQVAHALADPTERILVVSTTNRATDAAAISIGRAARSLAPGHLTEGKLLRIGKGASHRQFADEQLEDLLKGTETGYLAQIEELVAAIQKAESSEEKAILRHQVKTLRDKMRDCANRNFLDQNVSVVVSTAFRAMTFLIKPELRAMLEQGQTPFTTIFIDEAGLMSRAAVAPLSFWASRRVVLVGDSKQLAPISRISRILPTQQAKWMGSSALSHLDDIAAVPSGVHVLSEQRRMHPEIGNTVSHYQYGGLLTSAPETSIRTFALPSVLTGQPRAIWYVLDDDFEELPQIRAERGPGNRSWIRTATIDVLEQLLLDTPLAACRGLFITPFKAQGNKIASYFSKSGYDTWSASTVHSQQGAEAEVVIFDTVNAGSYGWPFQEWKRLVNVAISRAREALIVLSSRAEMQEPYLRPLLKHLAPRILKRRGKKFSWVEVSPEKEFTPPHAPQVYDPHAIGNQLTQRKLMRAVLSSEQQRLCGLKLDGKPRLVRGVAGSGKTVVLANWLLQTIQRLGDQPHVRIWAVYANRSLHRLLEDAVAEAWEKQFPERPFVADNFALHHIKDILERLLPQVGLSIHDFEFDYERAAEEFLKRKDWREIEPLCDAMFIDEAQDMGHYNLKLLAALVRRTSPEDENSRSINIFYDNAQNLYGRGTPKWSEFGLDMRGRSTVMDESFRSTLPITEFALNLLNRLVPPDANPDHRELVDRGLVELTERNGNPWWRVRFNQVDGPKPSFHKFRSIGDQFDVIAAELRRLITREGVQPSDICLIYNGRHIADRLQWQIGPKLKDLGVEISVQTNRPFDRSRHVILATTSHSYKGYDSEIVIIPAVDQFVAQERGILASNLYVAMTRARSMLTLFGQGNAGPESAKLCSTIEACLDDAWETPRVESVSSTRDDLFDILRRIGSEHNKWLEDIWKRFPCSQEPILSPTGEVIAEPLFWLTVETTVHACFGTETPKTRILRALEDHQIALLPLGANIANR